MALDKINEIRKAKRMTIDDLSKKSGVPLSTLKKISAGITTNPNLETVRSIVNALGCTLDDLIDDKNSNETTSNEDELNNPGILAELQSILKTLSEEEQLFLLDTVKAMQNRISEKNK